MTLIFIDLFQTSKVDQTKNNGSQMSFRTILFLLWALWHIESLIVLSSFFHLSLYWIKRSQKISTRCKVFEKEVLGFNHSHLEMKKKIK